MDINTQKLIENLAVQLGTTAKYLWSVLVKQAFINGIMDIVYIIVVGILIYLLYILHIYASAKYEDTYSGQTTKYEEYGEWWYPLIIFCGFIVAVLTIIAIGSIEDMITSFLNPEYWALNKILNKIK